MNSLVCPINPPFRPVPQLNSWPLPSDSQSYLFGLVALGQVSLGRGGAIPHSMPRSETTHAGRPEVTTRATTTKQPLHHCIGAGELLTPTVGKGPFTGPTTSSSRSGGPSTPIGRSCAGGSSAPTTLPMSAPGSGARAAWLVPSVGTSGLTNRPHRSHRVVYQVWVAVRHKSNHKVR